jgi:hypothetical protein
VNPSNPLAAGPEELFFASAVVIVLAQRCQAFCVFAAATFIFFHREGQQAVVQGEGEI